MYKERMRGPCYANISGNEESKMLEDWEYESNDRIGYIWKASSRVEVFCPRASLYMPLFALSCFLLPFSFSHSYESS